MLSPPGAWPSTASSMVAPTTSLSSSLRRDCETPPIASTSKVTLDVGYGYGNVEAFERQRELEYPALKNTHYLDYAASPPVPPSSVESFHASLASTLYANPHSRSTASVQTSLEIDRLRSCVLAELLGLSDVEKSNKWDVVWTSGATAGLKLVASAFDWKQERASFAYLRESHTSLVGMRGVALDQGAQVSSLSTSELELATASLVAYPAQCNATGSRLGLELCRRIKRRSPNSAVLVDAAAYVSTSVLDLSSLPLEEAPDLIVCSFYKCYGWPTGLGALVVKRSSGHLLRSDPYFGGGSISSLSTSSPFWVHRRASSGSDLTCHERLEAGTLPYLDIISLGHAMDTHKRLYTSQSHVSAHALGLSDFARSQLASLRHANGKSVVQVHQTEGFERPGSTIGFSLYDAMGQPIGHVHLDRLATINGFQLRTGGLCNTGIWTKAFDVTDEDLMRMHEQGRACWDDEEFDGEGTEGQRPLGIARISFGASSCAEDVLDFVEFVKKFFVETWERLMLTRAKTPPAVGGETLVKLETLTVYPIKSCGGQRIPIGSSWPIAPTGLAFDREWMIVDARTGRALSQKRYSQMVLIRPRVDLARRRLFITAPTMSDLDLPLDQSEFCSFDSSSDAQLCGDVVSTVPVSPEVDSWFSTFLGLPCQFRRFPSCSTSSRHAHFDGPPQPLLLSNESPFLLITSSSTKQVNTWIHKTSPSTPSIDAACFRANFELSNSPTDSMLPFFEDEIELLRIGDEFFQALGACRRCLMIGVNQETGEKTNEPFNTLARERKSKNGRIEFGTHMFWRQDLSRTEPGAVPSVKVGDVVAFVATSSHPLA